MPQMLQAIREWLMNLFHRNHTLEGRMTEDAFRLTHEVSSAAKELKEKIGRYKEELDPLTSLMQDLYDERRRRSSKWQDDHKHMY